ncbi:MAG TPA: aldo/keto reductase [Allosphingosinicella sp.]|nr:aldo/keto reductase [Allosphingosinicella sp.]
MERRYWYGLDREVAAAGFGCWQLAGQHEIDGKPHGFGDIAARDAVSLVHVALDRGVRFFDTAAAYGDGRSEALLGEALASSQVGQEAVVCTKIALRPEDEAAGRAGPGLTELVEQALGRLRRTHIDILLLHGPADATDWCAFDRSVLDGLRSSGKILAYGVSSRSLAGAERVLDANFGSCIEWAFNLIERRPAARLFPRLSEARMNFIARSPLSRGMIPRGQGRPDSRIFPETDFRSTLPEDWIRWAAVSAGKLQPLAHPDTLAVFALRYCLSYPEVSAVIPGIHQRWQIEDLLAAAVAGRLEAAALASISEAADECYPLWR